MSELIRGGGGGGGKGGGSAYKPKTAPDGLDSTQYAEVIDLISEGEIQGLKDGQKSIFLNNTPLLGVTKTGTYTQSGNTVTVTLADHGLAVDDNISIDITSGTAVDGTYTIASVVSENSFTYEAATSLTTNGNLTVNIYNFQNVTVYTRKGTQNQSAVPIASKIQNEVGVGVGVLKSQPVIRTITDPDVDAVRVTITVPQLQRLTSEGDIVGAKVRLQIAVQYNGGGFTTAIDNTIEGRSGDAYQRDYIVQLDGAKPVDIRVTRITDDSTTPKLVNAFDWTSYTEIIRAELRYPNSALVGIRIDAEQFNSIPTRTYQVRGIKVQIPSNATVDSATGRLIYSGIWDGTFGAAQWCSDPAWILWDLLTSTRYGFGDHIKAAQLDKWAFYSASQYASALVPDGFGGTEPRFSCNVNIQTAEDAYKLINDMASVFRAMPYWSAGALTVSQDKPADPAYLFTLANVAEEGFTYQSSSQKIRPTVAVVSYLDLETREIAYEAVEDQDAIAKYGVVTTQISAFACTSRGQAARMGEWLLYAEQYEAEVISFTASIDAGVVVRPGQIIEVADPMRAGSRRGGRISAATTTTVTVDDATGLPSSGGTVSVILPNGTVEQRTLSSRSGKVLTVSTAFSVAPNANSVWIYQNNSIQASQWRVLAVQEQEGSNYLVNALAYNASKYAYIERERPLQQRDITNLDQLPLAPTNLALSETLYLYQDQVRAKVIASWKPRVGVIQYQVRWRKDSGNWTVATPSGPDYEILDITPGLFEFEVYSVGPTFKLSATKLTGSINALGKTAPPSNVTGFAVVLDPDIGVTLNWNPISDLDLQGYEIWQGTGFGVGTKIGVFAATAKKIGLMPTGTTTWYIKALDTSGVYSTTAASVSLTITAAGAPTVGGSFAGENFVLTWDKIAGNLATDFYEIRYGTTSSTWSTATTLATSKSTAYTANADWLGTRRFFVAAVDVKGNVGTAGTFDAIVTAPTQPTISQQVIDNNVLLRWDDVTQTLPILSYELRRGATWAGATVIGTKQGRFTSVFETVSGAYTYWLAGIDSAGNYGTPGSVAALVNQPPDYVLSYDQDSTFSGTKTNTLLTNGALLATVNTTETWEDHFITRSWTTLQDQIDAGYPIYVQPSTTTGSYSEEIDFGAVLAGTKISSTLTSAVVSGSTTVTPAIRVRGTTSTAATYSQTTTTITVTSTAHGLAANDYVYLDFTSGTATDGTYIVATAATNSFTVTSATSATTSGNVSWIKWTNYAGVSSVYATSFRYAQIDYAFSSSGGDDLLTISELNVKLDKKLKSDTGTGTANSGDSGGTTVNFNVPFVDIEGINVTPSGTTARIAIYDFVDAPNPTSFKVLLFDTSGNRVTGGFSWQARGT